MENAFEFQPFGHAAIEQSIPERFQQQVAKHAGRVAIRTPGRCWTYDALNVAANQVANALIDELGAVQEPVALLMEQSAEAAISILGILKAGKFYLPLDTASPLIRLGKQLQSARPRLILTEPRHLEWASSLGESCGAVAVLTETLLKAPKTVNPEIDLTPERLAYLFFTSGSTGEPKGVVDSHRNVMHNVMRYTNGLRIAPDDRLSLIQSPSFSGTVSSLFSALLNGGTVCPFNVRREGFQALSSWVNDMGISVYHSVPAIFRGLTLGNQRFPSVRTVRLEGDQALPADVELYRKYFSDSCLLAIGLGATETGLSCQYIINQQQPLPSIGVPLGYPTQDMSISIIDEDGRDVGPLAAGEIAVGSRYLAVGYWHQPELQRSVFLPDPLDKNSRIYRTGDRGRLDAQGCLEFLGRQESRPRVRGQYLEIGDIEAALSAIEGVAQAAVRVQENDGGDSYPAAYLVANTTHRLTGEELRKRLSVRLPDSMIPDFFVYLDSLPVTPSGKIDRQALPNPIDIANANCKADAPRTFYESSLIPIWREALGAASIGVNDNFFDLGGNSLKAAEICAKVERELGIRADVDTLSANPTIVRLAEALRIGCTSCEAAIVPLQPVGSKPPIYFVHDHFGRISWYGPLAHRLGFDQPCYAIRAADDGFLPEGINSIEELATFYLDLIRSIQPQGTFHLAGLCFGAVVAFELAQQASVRDEAVGMLGLIGISPYDFPRAVSSSSAYLWRGHAFASRAWRKARSSIGRVPAALFTRGECTRQSAIRSLVKPNGESRSSDPGAGSSPLSGKSLVVARRHTRMFRGYTWRPYSGPIDLFLEARMVGRFTPDPESWQKLSTRPVSVHRVPFGISEMFAEEHVGALCTELQRSLRATGGSQ